MFVESRRYVFRKAIKFTSMKIDCTKVSKKKKHKLGVKYIRYLEVITAHTVVQIITIFFSQND